jgi:hypothetical protein
MAARGLQKAEDHAERGRLAGAVFAQEAIHFAPRNAKRHAIDRQHVLAAAGSTEAFCEFDDGDHVR